MNHRKAFTIIGVALAAISIAAVTAAVAIAGSSAPVADSARVPTTGPNAINPANCHFLHREVDVVTDLGSLEQKLAENGKYDIAEDGRHDAKQNCNTNLINKVKKMVENLKQTIGQPSTLHYMRVLASGTGQTVMVSCPAGFLVMSGGSQHETTGSYAVSNDTWAVVRDHLSPKVLDVRAVCIRVG
jgi:hypothetical protein